MIRILSHADIFSFVAFKCLQSESMDSRVLMEILKSMSMAISDAMSIATVQTLGLQQMRREAAIELAPKGSLTSEAKRKLRLALFTSKILFDGRIDVVYKENVAEIHETLVKKAIINQAKPNPSSVSFLPDALRLNLARIRLNFRRLLRRTLPSPLLDYLVEDHPLLHLLEILFGRDLSDVTYKILFSDSKFWIQNPMPSPDILIRLSSLTLVSY